MIRRLLDDGRDSESIALIEGGRGLRYRDLLEKAWRLRPHLPQGQREIIAILLPNGGDYIAALWGTLMAGMTAFPLHVLMTGHELLPLLKQASVRTVITVRAYWRVWEETPGFDALSLRILWMDQLETPAGTPEYGSVAVDTDAPMLLLNTSGTTGSAKIAQLSERNIETAVLGYLDKLCFPETAPSNIRYVLAMPFSSVYGMMILSVCLLRSFPILVLDDPFTLDGLCRLAERHRATHYEGSASTILMMAKMAGRAIPYDISRLTYFGFGGSKVSGDTIDTLQKAYPGRKFYQGYGMTEAAPLITKHPQGPLEKTHSVGTAIKGVELAVEVEGALVHTPYARGEIVVRGHNVMLGYLGNEAETARALRNGVLYTGDVGYLDDEGHLYLCGRKKNVVIVRGFNVHPEEVEACLQDSLLVRDAFVYGRADDDGNEILCAEVVPRDSQVDEEEIRRYCSTRLAEYKRPRTLRFCEAIRKNAAGKTVSQRHWEGP